MELLGKFVLVGDTDYRQPDFLSFNFLKNYFFFNGHFCVKIFDFLDHFGVARALRVFPAETRLTVYCRFSVLYLEEKSLIIYYKWFRF